MDGTKNLPAPEPHQLHLNSDTGLRKTITLSERTDRGGVGRGSVAVTEPDVGSVTRPEFRCNGRTTPGKGSANGSRPTILVPVDFLPVSINAVEHALVWAKQLHASILLLHVLDPIYTFGFPNLTPRQKVRQEARRRASELINMLAKSHAHEGVPITCALRDGLPESDSPTGRENACEHDHSWLPVQKSSEPMDHGNRER
jgi:hypothetical protein